MKTIYIMRHAKAEPADEDKIRPLAKEGWKELKKHSETHKDLFSKIQLVLCSSSQRTRETLDGIRECLPDRVTISYIDDLYDSSASKILEEISFSDDKFSTVMIIAHNPGVTDFMHQVCQMHNLPQDQNMVTSSIAEYQMQDLPWSKISFSTLKFVKLYERS